VYVTAVSASPLNDLVAFEHSAFLDALKQGEIPFFVPFFCYSDNWVSIKEPSISEIKYLI
jgi:hypothetical protein